MLRCESAPGLDLDAQEIRRLGIAEELDEVIALGRDLLAALPDHVGPGLGEDVGTIARLSGARSAGGLIPGHFGVDSGTLLGSEIQLHRDRCGTACMNEEADSRTLREGSRDVVGLIERAPGVRGADGNRGVAGNRGPIGGEIGFGTSGASRCQRSSGEQQAARHESSLAQRHRRFPYAYVGVVVATLAVGCVPSVTIHVPRAAVASLPLEQRLTLLDAESDVLAAQDARDRQEEELQKADVRIADAEARLNASRRALDAAVRNATNQDIAKAAVEEAEARRKYAEQSAALERRLLGVSDLSVELAKARFELARAKEVDTAGQSGRYGVHVADFQHQAEAISKSVEERMQEGEHERAAVTDAQQTWKTAAQQLANLTGGAQGSVWVQ